MTLKQYIGASLLILGSGFIAYFAVRSHLSPTVYPPAVLTIDLDQGAKGLWATGATGQPACPFWEVFNKAAAAHDLVHVEPGDYSDCPEIEVTRTGPHEIGIRIKITIPTCESLEDPECGRKR